MKHFKLSMLLLLTVAIFTSCEEETTPILESSEMNKQKMEKINEYGPMSMLDLLDAGIDIESYLNSLPKPLNSASKSAVYARTESSDLQFYYSAEDISCNNLPNEDFTTANNSASYCISNYLDKNTDTYAVSPGDILPGISFEMVRNYDFDYVSRYLEYSSYETYNYEQMDAAMNDWINGCGLYVSTYIGQLPLMPAYYFTDLIISFSGNNAKNVSMDLYNGSSTNEIIEIYGASDNLLGTDVVYVNRNDNGTFWAVESLEPISKIVIKSQYIYGSEGVDNVSFGNCADLDGDGILNEEDPYPTSNMSESLSIGYNNLDIENVFTAAGTTMMDQIDALVAEINAQYNGDNYDELHRDFTRALSKITYYWSKDRLITRRERSAISSAAWSADVPMTYDNE